MEFDMVSAPYIRLDERKTVKTKSYSFSPKTCEVDTGDNEGRYSQRMDLDAEQDSK